MVIDRRITAFIGAEKPMARVATYGNVVACQLLKIKEGRIIFLV